MNDPRHPRRAAAASLALTALLAACSATRAKESPLAERTPAASPATRAPAAPVLELVESWPVETTLDHPDIPDAADVWLEMVDGARERLDFAQFYASNQEGSRLEPIVAAVERAADRGVRVRFLTEAKFARTYPETLERLDARPGIEVRRFDVAALTGGILHAKYFVADGREAYVGSQNFDWRSLEHIQELGVRVRARPVVEALAQVFDADWALAGGASRDEALAARAPHAFPFVADEDGQPLRITPVFSPKDLLPDHDLWDLPRLVAMIDGAERSVRVQLLSYRTSGRGGVYFDELDSALRRAAERGVDVRMLLADWSKREGSVGPLQSLQALPRIEVELVTIPPWSGGHVPYGRVIHAKYLTVDGATSWIGTSNWEQGYFLASRNVGFVVESRPFAAELERFFDSGWTSDYAYAVDPDATYEPPRIGD